ncbi:MAG: GNAT family N-acetyltransferase [Armatimonadetes bacterium]|nr:GNAT family N-acetyltransferase [Armatimonadota bacterium]
MAHYELRPFALAEAETVASWAASLDDRRDLDGSSQPLTADDVAVWTMETNWAFTLRRDGDLVAYGEVVEDEVENDVEIQHILVAPDMRRAGVGQALVSRLCAFLAASRPYREVWLRAGRQNEALLACARAVGFSEVDGMSGPRYQWLRKSLARLPASDLGGVERPPAPNSGGAGS